MADHRSRDDFALDRALGGARRFDVVLPHDHAGETNTQQSVAPQPRAGDHLAVELERPRIEAAVRPLYVEGYTAELSYCAGDTVDFCVSTSAPTFALSIARIGAVCETVFEAEGIDGVALDVPENAASHGCSWPASYSLTVPPAWRSGYYEAALYVEDDAGADWTHRGRRTATSVMGFVVRAARPTSRILLQLATNTYNAYNNWGGHCLYGGFGQQEAQGTRVSFERPMAGLFHKYVSLSSSSGRPTASADTCWRAAEQVGAPLHPLGGAAGLHHGLRGQPRPGAASRDSRGLQPRAQRRPR